MSIRRINFGESPTYLSAVLATMLGTAIFVTMSRGFRLPLDYTLGHWLLNYGHGFIKRGMIGTLVSPLFHYKSPYEIRLIVQTLSTVTLCGLGALMVYAARAVLFTNGKLNLLCVFPAFVFATASFHALAAGWNGFFDHFLEIITLIGIFAIRKDRLLCIPFLSMFALCIHEVFIVYGFPVLAIAVWMKLTVMRQQNVIVLRRAVFIAIGCILPVIVLYLSILLTQAGHTQQFLAEVRESVAAEGVFTEKVVDDIVLFHLRKDIVDNYRLQTPTSFFTRIANPQVARNVYPVTAFITLCTFGILLVNRRFLFASAILGAAICPLAAHLFAWDTHRFSNFTIFQSFMLLVSVVVILEPKMTISLRRIAVLFAVSVPVIVNNISGVVQIDWSFTDANSVLAMRNAPTLLSVQAKPRLFFNSDFEAGNLANWKVSKGDLLQHPKDIYISEFRFYQDGAEGGKWYGTYSMVKHNGLFEGDVPTGELTSIPFTVKHEEILFFISGGAYKDKTYAALDIDGKEVYRASGKNKDAFEPVVWDVREFKNKSATIRVVDKASGAWGHINVDGFCFSP